MAGVPSEHRDQFGLPRKGSSRGNVRRAKPLFMHVHATLSGKFIPLAVYLPAQFLEHEPDMPNGGRDILEFLKQVEEI